MQQLTCHAKEIKENEKIRPTSKLGAQLTCPEHGHCLLSVVARLQVACEKQLDQAEESLLVYVF